MAILTPAVSSRGASFAPASELLLDALQNPAGTERLCDIVKPGEKIAIITSDITRPFPGKEVLPAVIEEIKKSGARYSDITIVFALGSHRHHTEEEKIRLVGEKIFNRIKCADSTPDDCVRMGVTSKGTPVDISRVVAEADRRVCLGNVEFHYFAGYSGGAKAIMPGVSTRHAIQNNHKMMLHPDAKAGLLDGNPVREDIEEAISYCPIDFILNVVLDGNKKIAFAAAGHHIHAHRKACEFLDGLYKKKISSRADIVIASQGGAPKDINLYQTQKALDNAANAVKDGGVIILVGACDEGMGEKTFERWMTEANSPTNLTERIERDFQLGGHKAAAIAQVLEKADIFLVSNMKHDFVEKLFMRPYADAQTALDDALAKLGRDSSILIMPNAGSTLPYVEVYRQTNDE